jgi:hypothetical protein
MSFFHPKGPVSDVIYPKKNLRWPVITAALYSGHHGGCTGFVVGDSLAKNRESVFFTELAAFTAAEYTAGRGQSSAPD